jgi:hypothetical protein
MTRVHRFNGAANGVGTSEQILKLNRLAMTGIQTDIGIVAIQGQFSFIGRDVLPEIDNVRRSGRREHIIVYRIGRHPRYGAIRPRSSRPFQDAARICSDTFPVRRRSG